MSNRINNKYEYRSGLLDSLKVEHTASDVRNEDEYRKKVLNGLGVEFTDDDINQKSLYRAKVVEGLASSGGGGGGETWNTVYEGNVTTAETEGMPYPTNTSDITLTLSGADRIKVTFNGTEYELPKVLIGANFGYGALSQGSPDLDTYPLFIGQNSGSIIVFTQTAGTYSLKIEEQSGGGSSDFSTANVTVNATIDNTGSVLPPICALNMPTIAPQETATGYAGVANGTTQYTVILYKGKAVAFSQNHGEKTQLYVTSSSGNVEYDEENMECIITGDCVLNVTNVQP